LWGGVDDVPGEVLKGVIHKTGSEEDRNSGGGGWARGGVEKAGISKRLAQPRKEKSQARSE